VKLAYYPGCSGEGTSKEYDVSTRAICEALGFTLTTIDDWSCCGSTPGHSLDHALSAALSARNLVLASSTDAECVVTPCPSCLSNLKHAKHRMENPEFKIKVDELLDEPTPEALLESYSVLQVIVEKLSMEEITAKVKKPLKGLKVACYYGCLMVRPPKVMQFDDYENPMSLDKILIALGAEVVPFPLKTECCGASVGIVDKKITASLSGRILERAKQFGANCVVTACPLCQMNLDLRQAQAENEMDQKFDLPIFYYTQLLGLALGLDDSALMMNKLVVSPKALLKSLGTEVKTEKDEEKAKPIVKPTAEAKPEAKAEVKTEAKLEAKPEVKAAAKPEVKAEAKPEVKTGVKPEATAKPKKTTVKAKVKSDEGAAS